MKKSVEVSDECNLKSDEQKARKRENEQNEKDAEKRARNELKVDVEQKNRKCQLEKK